MKFVLSALVFVILVSGCTNLLPTVEFDQPEEKECFKTSVDNNHQHDWCRGDEYTKETCEFLFDCHKHQLDEPANLASRSDGHTHQLS